MLCNLQCFTHTYTYTHALTHMQLCCAHVNCTGIAQSLFVTLLQFLLPGYACTQVYIEMVEITIAKSNQQRQLGDGIGLGDP